MFFRHLVYSLASAVLLLPTATAQTTETPQPAKARQTEIQKANELKALALLEEVVANAQTLKVVANRLRIQVIAADLIWPRDEKRARSLFEKSIADFIELVGGIDEADPNYYNVINGLTQLHNDIIQILVRREPQMALDFLHSARLPRHPEAASRYVTASHEVQMELQIASQIVGKKSKLALQTALDSLDKGFSSNVVGLLSQLQEKDREGATKLAGALVRKLLAENLFMNNEAASVAVGLLNMASQMEGHGTANDGKRIVGVNTSALLDAQAYRDLFELVVKAALAAPLGHNSSDWRERNIAQTLLTGMQSLMTTIQESTPARAAALQRRLAEFRKNTDSGTRFWQDNQEVLQNGGVDDILALSSKVPPEMRDQVFQQAAWKAMGQGDIERATQIINEGVSNPMYRRQMLDEIERQAATKAASDGKVDHARQMISRLRNVEDRTRMLIQLANTLSNKSDKTAARRLLEEARGLVIGKAENFGQIQAQLDVARALARIEQAEGLDILEQIVSHFNELLGAAEVLNGFDEQYYKDGELLWQSTSLSNVVSQVINDLGQLAPEQFDRVKEISERFQRPEVRMMAQLAAARAVLSDGSPISQPMDRRGFHTITIG